jgi:hypothetical protein
MTKHKKMRWKCPYCSQASSRKWNIEIHMKRRHIGHDLPLPMNYDVKTAAQDEMTPERCSKPYSMFQYPDLSEFLWPFSLDDKKFQQKDDVDDFITKMQSMLNLTSIFSSTTSKTPAIPTRYFPHSIHGPCFYNGLGVTPRTSETNLQKENFERILGFSARHCNLCLSNEVVPIVKLSRRSPVIGQHFCSPDRLQEVQFLTSDERNRLAMVGEQKIPDSLFRRCKEWIREGAYLQTYPIDPEGASSKKIGIDNLKKDSWIVRAIYETTILLTDSELFEFLVMAHNETAGYFCLYSVLGRKYCYYLYAIIRKPLQILL